MEPVTLLTWANVVLEIGGVGVELLDLGRRLQAGEKVNIDELQAAKQATRKAVAAWDAGADKARS